MPRIKPSALEYAHRKGYITVAEAAKLAMVSPGTIYNRMADEEDALEKWEWRGITFVHRRHLAAAYPEVRERILKETV